MADLDAAFMQMVLDIAERQREPDVHHHGQANDLGRGLEVPEREALGHPARLGDRPARLTDFALTLPLRYIHLSEADRGTPGRGNVSWDEVFAALAAIGFEGGLAMESFINMPEDLAWGLSDWLPVTDSAEAVIEEWLGFLRSKCLQYGLLKEEAAE